MKILKKITAVIICIAAAMLSACSGYVMDEEDLEVQKKLEGFWIADESVGCNTYDENGLPIMLVVVEFTDDFRYYMHQCYVNDGYVMTYDPISYTLEKKNFRVDVDGVPTYAGISFNEDASRLYWITESKTDTYERLSEEGARLFGIPERVEEEQSDQQTESSSEATAEDTGRNTDDSQEE